MGGKRLIKSEESSLKTQQNTCNISLKHLATLLDHVVRELAKCMQHLATSKNVATGLPLTYATHCMQQCYKMLLWNVECVWLGLKNTNQWPRHDWISESCWGTSNKIIQLNFNALILRWKEELQWSQKQIRKWIGLSFQKMRLCLWVSKLNKHRVKILHKGYVWEVSFLYCFVP